MNIKMRYISDASPLLSLKRAGKQCELERSQQRPTDTKSCSCCCCLHMAYTCNALAVSNFQFHPKIVLPISSDRHVLLVGTNFGGICYI